MILLCVPEWVTNFINWLNTPEVVLVLKHILSSIALTAPPITTIIGVVIAIVKGSKTMTDLGGNVMNYIKDNVSDQDTVKALELEIKKQLEDNAQLKLMVADLISVIEGIRVKVDDYGKEKDEQSQSGV